MGKVKVLQLINSAKRGGGAAHLWELVSNLSKKDYEFEIVISPDGPYLKKFKNAGFDVHPVDMMSGRFQKRAINEIKEIITTVQPDLIHAHGTRAAFFAARCHHEYFSPKIYSVHGLSYNKDVGLLTRVFYRQIERFICEKMDCVISVSKSDGSEMVENEITSDEKLKVIQNGVDIKRFKPAKAPKSSIKTIGTITRLIEQKGVKYLIEALAILKVMFDFKPKLLVIGDGPAKGKLENRAFKYGVLDQIEWIGSVEDTTEYYHKFDVFVLPSLGEGFPLVLLEAMASALPVISTDTSGGLDLVKDEETGILVRKRDSNAIAIAIKRLFDDNRLAKKVSRNARKEIEDNYTLNRCIKSIEITYQDLLM